MYRLPLTAEYIERKISKLKDFQEFIDLIDPDEYRTILASARTSISMADKHQTEDAAFFTALELLKRYHTWINQG